MKTCSLAMLLALICAPALAEELDPAHAILMRGNQKVLDAWLSRAQIALSNQGELAKMANGAKQRGVDKASEEVRNITFRFALEDAYSRLFTNPDVGMMAHKVGRNGAETYHLVFGSNEDDGILDVVYSYIDGTLQSMQIDSIPRNWSAISWTTNPSKIVVGKSTHGESTPSAPWYVFDVRHPTDAKVANDVNDLGRMLKEQAGRSSSPTGHK